MEVLFAVIGGFLFLALVAAIIAGTSWCFWSLWCWVLPQVWANGPENIIRPSWLLFFAATFLISWVSKVVFGGARKSKD